MQKDPASDIVENTFKVLLRFGAYTGGCLPHITFRNAVLTQLIRIALAFVILGFGCFGIAAVSATLVPTPAEREQGLQFETFTVLKAVYICSILDFMSCFAFNVYAYRLFSRRSFFEECHHFGFKPVSPQQLSWIRSWARACKLGIAFLILTMCIFIPVMSVLYSSFVMMLSSWKMERASYWLGLSPGMAATLIVLSMAATETQSLFFGMFYWTLCGLVRIRFQICCDNLSTETAASFSRRLIDKYHAEYARLVSMVKILDKAFRLTCLIQLALVIVSTCYCLYFVVQGNIPILDMGMIGSTLFFIILIFVVTVYPAIRLQNQVSPRSGILWLR